MPPWDGTFDGLVGEESGVLQSMPFYGDFYHAQNDVTRGVELAPTVPGGPHGGDPWAVQELGCAEMAALIAGAGLEVGSAYGAKVCDTDEEPGRPFFHFDGLASPPPLPEDALFPIEESTSITLILGHGQRPADLGNALLEFLKVDVASTIIKVNPCKYTVKANVFEDYRTCTIKARFYQRTGNGYVLAVQRRKGDGVAFAALFQKVEALFVKKGWAPKATSPLSSAAKVPFAAFFVPLGVPGEGAGLIDTFGPLLHLLAGKMHTGLNAEAVCALADAVEAEMAQCEMGGSSILDTDCVRHGVQRLLRCPDTEVAFPLARVLTRLMEHGSAVPLWVTDPGLAAGVEEARAAAACPLVRAELGKVAGLLVQQHVGGRGFQRAGIGIPATSDLALGVSPARTRCDA